MQLTPLIRAFARFRNPQKVLNRILNACRNHPAALLFIRDLCECHLPEPVFKMFLWHYLYGGTIDLVGRRLGLDRVSARDLAAGSAVMAVSVLRRYAAGELDAPPSPDAWPQHDHAPAA